MIDLSLGGIEDWSRRHHPDGISGRARDPYDCPLIRYAQTLDPNIFAVIGANSVMHRFHGTVDVPAETMALVSLIDTTHSTNEAVTHQAMLNLIGRVRAEWSGKMIDPLPAVR